MNYGWVETISEAKLTAVPDIYLVAKPLPFFHRSRSGAGHPPVFDMQGK